MASTSGGSTSGGSPTPGSSGNRLVVGVVLMLAVSIGLSLLVSFRVAAYALATVLAAVAAGRALLPLRLVGPLAVRSRALDVVTCGLMAGALVVLARGVPL